MACHVLQVVLGKLTACKQSLASFACESCQLTISVHAVGAAAADAAEGKETC